MSAKSVVGICLAILLSSLEGKAQVDSLPRLEITTGKTTVILFHFHIRSVDRGSRDVLVQKVRGADTILEVKAARAGFPETNLTIVTGDGVVHMFEVVYSLVPSVLRYALNAAKTNHEYASVNNISASLSEADYEELNDSILHRPMEFRRIRDCSYGTAVNLSGLFIHQEELFFRFHLRNKSHIPYDIGQLNFYIRDKRQSKRTASQDLVQTPLFLKGDHDRLEGKSTLDFVTALPKFTIPNKKVLFIVLKERNGGRLLRLRVRNRQLMRAREI